MQHKIGVLEAEVEVWEGIVTDLRNNANKLANRGDHNHSAERDGVLELQSFIYLFSDEGTMAGWYVVYVRNANSKVFAAHWIDPSKSYQFSNYEDAKTVATRIKQGANINEPATVADVNSVRYQPRWLYVRDKDGNDVAPDGNKKNDKSESESCDDNGFDDDKEEAHRPSHNSRDGRGRGSDGGLSRQLC